MGKPCGPEAILCSEGATSAKAGTSSLGRLESSGQGRPSVAVTCCSSAQKQCPRAAAEGGATALPRTRDPSLRFVSATSALELCTPRQLLALRHGFARGGVACASGASLGLRLRHLLGRARPRVAATTRQAGTAASAKCFPSSATQLLGLDRGRPARRKNRRQKAQPPQAWRITAALFSSIKALRRM